MVIRREGGRGETYSGSAAAAISADCLRHGSWDLCSYEGMTFYIHVV